MSHQDENKPVAILISRDLMFTSKVSGTAAALGYCQRTFADGPSALQAESSNWDDCRCLFIDLETPGLNIVEFMQSLPGKTSVKVVAYGPHVHSARLQAAEEAGCDQVLSRGNFSAKYVEFLKAYLP